MWLPFLTAWQLGSEREFLRMSFPRDPGRGRRPSFLKPNSRTPTSNLPPRSPRLKGKGIRLYHPQEVKSNLQLQRGEELMMATFEIQHKISSLLLCFPNEIMTIHLCYHYSTVCFMQCKEHWIQSKKAKPTVPTSVKTYPKQQLGSEVPMHPRQLLGSGAFLCLLILLQWVQS